MVQWHPLKFRVVPDLRGDSQGDHSGGDHVTRYRKKLTAAFVPLSSSRDCTGMSMG